MCTELLQTCQILFTLTYVAVVCIIGSPVCTEETVPVRVTRRLGGDLYYFCLEPGRHHACPGGTYIVEENRCVSNRELINGKISLALV